MLCVTNNVLNKCTVFYNNYIFYIYTGVQLIYYINSANLFIELNMSNCICVYLFVRECYIGIQLISLIGTTMCDFITMYSSTNQSTRCTRFVLYT